MHWRKDSLLNKWCWENWLSTCRSLKLDPSLLPCTSINSKWIKDLNVRAETEITTGKIKNMLDYLGIGNNCMNKTPISQQLRERTDKWDCTKLKSFCTVNKSLNYCSVTPWNSCMLGLYPQTTIPCKKTTVV
jgi:hypothetical protein